MIWIRRLITIPLGLVFFVLLFAALAILEANNTFLDPDFYTEELDKADAYEFVLVDLLTSAIDDARKVRPGEGVFEDLDINPIVESRLTTEEIVASINRAIPPEWLQELAEQASDQLGRFLTAERDEFQFNVRAGDRAEILVDEIKALLLKADAYNILYEEVVTPFIDEAVTESLPLGVEVSIERLVSSARIVAPPEWVREQVESALDEGTAYMVGRQDSMEISVQLADRVEIALEEIKALLRETNAYDLLYDEVVGPVLFEVVGGAVDLPSGISVREEDLVSALREVAPVEWVQEQAEGIIDNAGPYLTGKVESFTIDISLEENRTLASRLIADLVATGFEEAVSALPECGADLTLSDLSAFQEQIRVLGLPLCVPSIIDRDRVLSELMFRVGTDVDHIIHGLIPSRISFTSDDLRETLVVSGAVDNIDRIDDVRELLRDGWTYTDQDLREDLRGLDGEDNVEILDDVRAFLANGWTYTDGDLREDIPAFRKSDGGGDVIEVRKSGDLERGRGYFDRARTFRWVVYAPAVLLLVIIGFLGGRGWRGRTIWASILLSISSVLILIGSGPVYGAFADDAIEDAREELNDNIDFDPEFQDTKKLLIDKVADVTESVADRFASGIVASSRNLLIVGLLVLAGALVWPMISRSRRRPEPEP